MSGNAAHDDEPSRKYSTEVSADLSAPTPPITISMSCTDSAQCAVRALAIDDSGVTRSSGVSSHTRNANAAGCPSLSRPPVNMS